MSQSPLLNVLVTEGFGGYALLDCGAGRKLERFGDIIVNRPEPQALWAPRLDAKEWSKAHAVFSASAEDDEKGKWRLDGRVPDAWAVQVEKATMLCKLGGLWHLGLFPEQLPHWRWMLDRLARVKAQPPRVLNLFGYTGAASLIAAAAGADVTHVDASKKAVSWARENQEASGLQSAKIRWIVDDAAKFVARDVRRGKTYDVILVDPPKFGRGPEGEVWDLFAGLPPLLDNIAKLLAPENAALVLTVYAIRASALAFEQLTSDALAGKGGAFECGELAVRARSGRLVPTSLYVRWSAGI